IMLHDGGGDRSQTLAAVRELIPRLRARGFRFVSLSTLAGLPRAVVAPPAGRWAHARGFVFELSVQVAFAVIAAISVLLLTVGVLGLDRVHLVRQDNGGKAAALNTGLELTDAEIVVMVDGDTLFERDTLRRLVAPLRNPEVGAVSGNTKVGNRRGLLGRWQHIEYVVGFNLDRRMYDVLQF